MWLKKIFLTIAATCLIHMVNAQKPEKGSTPERAWNEDVKNGRLYFADSTEKYSLHQTSNLDFGKWSFTANYPFYKKSDIKQLKDSLKFLPLILGWPRWVKGSITYYNTIETKGIDPNKNKFSGKFYFTDSLFETYDEKGFFSKVENYQAYLLRKTAKGYILTTKGDSADFNIILYFENQDSLSNQQSFIHIGNNNIILKPVFESNKSKRDPIRDLYLGFDFVQNDKIIAGAVIGNGFMGSIVYKYWMSKDLDENTRQIVASTIFVIVDFF